MRYHPGNTLRDAVDILRTRTAPHIEDKRAKAELIRVADSLAGLERLWHLAPDFVREYNAATSSLLAEVHATGSMPTSASRQESDFDADFAEYSRLNEILAEVVYFLEGADAEQALGERSLVYRDKVRHHLNRWLDTEGELTRTDLSRRQPD